MNETSIPVRGKSPASVSSGTMDGSLGPVEAQAKRLTDYHTYLEKNYKCGVDRFFNPTGFLAKFNRNIAVVAQHKRDAVFVKDMKDAAGRLQKVIDGAEGVFDLAAEPGTGKTSVLPFRFPSSRVVVALPTPFEAWSAFNSATSKAQLKLKGLTLGAKDARVVYMDSYMAANMVLSGFMEYDVLMVDECDSGKGVTAFLSDVKAPGKVLVRMSASHGRSDVASSSSFSVTENHTMPNVMDGIDPLVEYVKTNARGRSLLLAPDAATAAKLSELLPESRLVSSNINLGEMVRFVLEQKDDVVFISDDVCARGLNLNLDVVFDCQLVSEHGITRTVNKAEAYQRRGRVGRNKAGYYHSAGLPATEVVLADADIVRSNVVRAVAELPQAGHTRTHVDKHEAEELLCHAEEPFVAIMRKETERALEDEFRRRSQSPTKEVAVPSAQERPFSPESQAMTSGSSFGSSGTEEVKVPAWMMWGMNRTGKDYGASVVQVAKSQKRGGQLCFRRTSSSSDDSKGPSRGALVAPVGGHLSPRVGTGRAVGGLPYSGKGRVDRPRREVVSFRAPDAPPVMDLSLCGFDYEWPALLNDLVETCGDLPTIVPPNNWQHTALGGIGSDWMARLETLAVTQPRFEVSEFEVVCRAWNMMVATTWVRKTPGLSVSLDVNKMEFCLRYFQMYYQLASSG